jgi:hypothetical protein
MPTLVLAKTDDRQIAELDPLAADEFFSYHFCKLNEEGDKAGLVEAAKRFVDRARRIPGLDANIARAVTRDLGFLASALVRHGLTLQEVPDLEAVLLDLAKLTLEVPRDTVFSYAARNPTGTRQRSYTSLPEERLFIDSVRGSCADLHACLEEMMRGAASVLGSKAQMQHLERAVRQLNKVTTAILEVRRVVSPECFSFVLRPYFPVLVLGGKEYFGPGGAQLAVLLVDLILYGCSDPAPAYAAYVKHSMDYLPKSYRDFAGELTDKASLVDLAERSIQQQGPSDAAVALNCVVNDIFTSLLKFRYPHRQLARENFKLRPPTLVGSGGYDTGILDVLIERTTAARARLAHTERTLEVRPLAVPTIA